jgi:large subunit ribosomal protein L22
MAYRAIHRYARIAPDKARLIANLIRGRNVADAMSELTLSKKRAAAFYRKVLNSAIANAEERDADVESLFVSEARVDEGPPMKRWQPKDRGRAHPILKRTSHLHLAVEERS